MPWDSWLQEIEVKSVVCTPLTARNGDSWVICPSLVSIALSFCRIQMFKCISITLKTKLCLCDNQPQSIVALLRWTLLTADIYSGICILGCPWKDALIYSKFLLSLLVIVVHVQHKIESFFYNLSWYQREGIRFGN